MKDTRSEQWEKNSQRFEVRLPHSKKLAFQEACDRQGDTPSAAVRRSIESYLIRSEVDDFRHALRGLKRVALQNWKPTLAAFCIGFPIAYLVASS
ncbi:MAG: hypothetical protein KJP27_03780 [Altererythrobacter sp.]|nr:hypothetical protein [Altererythrobacter sp.]